MSLKSEIAKLASVKDISAYLYTNGMGCNCDLDNWEPNKSTGHSSVCRIHNTALKFKYAPHDFTDAWVIK
jgi:hypothetical protein